MNQDPTESPKKLDVQPGQQPVEAPAEAIVRSGSAPGSRLSESGSQDIDPAVCVAPADGHFPSETLTDENIR